MAGIMTPGDEGREIAGSTVPSIGGPAQVASNPDDGLRAEGVHYDSNNSVGVSLDTGGYPTGTDVGEKNNPLRP